MPYIWWMKTFYFDSELLYLTTINALYMNSDSENTECLIILFSTYQLIGVNINGWSYYDGFAESFVN